MPGWNESGPEKPKGAKTGRHLPDVPTARRQGRTRWACATRAIRSSRRCRRRRRCDEACFLDIKELYEKQPIYDAEVARRRRPARRWPDCWRRRAHARRHPRAAGRGWRRQGLDYIYVVMTATSPRRGRVPGSTYAAVAVDGNTAPDASCPRPWRRNPTWPGRDPGNTCEVGAQQARARSSSPPWTATPAPRRASTWRPPARVVDVRRAMPRHRPGRRWPLDHLVAGVRGEGLLGRCSSRLIFRIEEATATWRAAGERLAEADAGALGLATLAIMDSPAPPPSAASPVSFEALAGGCASVCRPQAYEWRTRSAPPARVPAQGQATSLPSSSREVEALYPASASGCAA